MNKLGDTFLTLSSELNLFAPMDRLRGALRKIRSTII